METIIEADDLSEDEKSEIKVSLLKFFNDEAGYEELIDPYELFHWLMEGRVPYIGLRYTRGDSMSEPYHSIKECPLCKGKVAHNIGAIYVRVVCRGTCINERDILNCERKYYDPEIIKNLIKEDKLKYGYA